MIFAVTVNLTRTNAYGICREVIKKLQSLGGDVYLSLEHREVFADLGCGFFDDESYIAECDFVIVIGGDGTFIHASHSAALYGKKILGINAGNLGFLAGMESSELDLLEKLFSGDYELDSRLMLKCGLYDSEGRLRNVDHCLNDVVIARGDALRLCEIEVTAGHDRLASYHADGVVVSTPTGSTAYSLSAGGPIVEPTLESIILTPISPHTLFARPIILRHDRVVEITVKNPSVCNSVFSCDGDAARSLGEGDTLRISRADFYAKIVRIKSDGFTEILSKKLRER